MDNVEVENVEPRLLEFIESEGGDVSEKAVRSALQPVRTMIISKAIRKLFQQGKLERTGKGRKGSPFLYSMAFSLDSIGVGGYGGKGIGNRKAKNREKPLQSLRKFFSQEIKSLA